MCKSQASMRHRWRPRDIPMQKLHDRMRVSKVQCGRYLKCTKFLLLVARQQNKLPKTNTCRARVACHHSLPSGALAWYTASRSALHCEQMRTNASSIWIQRLVQDVQFQFDECIHACSELMDGRKSGFQDH